MRKLLNIEPIRGHILQILIEHEDKDNNTEKE